MKIRLRKIAHNKTIIKYTASHLNLVYQSHAGILNKSKTSTIRLGHLFFVDKTLPLKFEDKPDIIVKIKAINYIKPLKDLSEEDATTLGVAVADYWYWQVFSLANILLAFIFTFVGFAIFKKDEPET
jgi:phage-related protein